ncbi:nitrogen fixation protein NifZ [Methyloprofundus sedimenti]|uniref:Nitrogen fixation protein NifZ n=1 Tax=Methyloprofundus sedimenti TaxID=1420851 RepID=A0A1V8M1W1_9GAMM|nr:nitrogen fixation protein NifZ [Methyloprofundus sedimenti]OQK15544.1 nitrogen fixation protein NifZ [Methyloprofundus sedimenti]
MNLDGPDEGRFDFGEEVRVTRNVRNDGTYPGKEVGDILIRRGCVGNVVEVGTFLQDQVIYTVHFIKDGCMVGCRVEELIGIDEPWNPSRFEFRDKVVAKLNLAIKGKIAVPIGTEGEIEKVVRDTDPVIYHVRFPGITLQVPEASLGPRDTDQNQEITEVI